MLVIISFKCISKSFNWSHLVGVRRDEMFYTEHDFQVDLENFEFNLKFHAERLQDICR